MCRCIGSSVCSNRSLTSFRISPADPHTFCPGFDNRSHLFDVFKICSDCFVLPELRRDHGRHSRPVGQAFLLRIPFSSSKFRWIDSSDLTFGVDAGPFAGRMQRPTLVVVENPTHRRAVVEQHSVLGIDLWA